MRWPPWSSGPQKDTDNGEKDKDKSEHNSITSSLTSSFNATDPDTSSPSKKREWNSILNATDWKQFSEPQNLIPTVILTTGILFAVHLHRRFLRRIPEASNINPSYFRRRSLLGRVTSVGDGDNFRLYHTPGGRLAGWGWLPWKKVPTSRKELKDRTIHVRLAGIDAPELPHFGRPAQPFSEAAHSWLTSYLLHNRVRAYVYRQDQYSRVIATVYKRKYLFFRQDVGLQMLKQGLATVYEAKSGMEFGGEALERKYRKAEEWAKKRRKGLWKGQGGAEWESPREYKNRFGGHN